MYYFFPTSYIPIHLFFDNDDPDIWALEEYFNKTVGGTSRAWNEGPIIRPKCGNE